ncbi:MULTISPECIES: secondary thiamine-phosphate synthase enzyme YjbQ [unclassified Legionella]|uniref:secondary thiamine-phosphate synthase enzyme YjbQ n=1 Tax=unclassified Legionella TaxID=2622702 RepID=UPI0010564FCE|nr:MULTISPECIES: secondary thiamine-phosphate synthase enzyme YjbQ [unclassified Legionella]MDI9818141.1 secondary thiamine-phosphate synthase enzyme YjbQ [Legionella sp. PL877]
MANTLPVYWQSICTLTAKPRGFHLIGDELGQALSNMPAIHTGLVHLFLQHTSASLAISENACRDVRQDLETYFSKTIPDDRNLYTHTLEGEDDMPAHIKNVLIGASLTIPVQEGKLALGQWQGIYLCEHRNQASARRIVITAHGII